MLNPVVPVAINKPEPTQMFEEIFVKTTCPLNKFVAETCVQAKCPVVADAVATPAAPLELEEAYPDVVTLPAPNCICTSDVPFVLTPLNITVMRFTHDGMLVKSIEVPEVEATAVPEISALLTPLITTVPVPAGIVAV